MSVTTRRTRRGERTHRTILQRAVDIASVEGLEGLTIGRLSSELGMSKSGLFAHFGSKEDLQLATVEEAQAVFHECVSDTAREHQHGIERVWRLCDAWIAYLEGQVFKGGCFFAAAAVEFDGRPGPVRDQIVRNISEWMNIVIHTVNRAVELGDMQEDIDPKQIAFEVQSIGLGANWARQLYHDMAAGRRARHAILLRLHQLSVHPDPSIPSPSAYT